MKQQLSFVVLVCAFFFWSCGPGLEPGDEPLPSQKELAQTDWVTPVFTSWIAGGKKGLVEGQRDGALFAGISGVCPVVGHLDRLLVSDSVNHRVRLIAGERVSTFAGSGLSGLLDPSARTGSFVDGPTYAARFSHPQDVAMDGAGRVYVADSGNHRVRRVAAGEVTTYAGLPSTGSDDGGLL
ncbi:MAG: hypothetical protein JRH20_26310, partial [Deltaproteobacteria bacterium]|nr:hypothetical protein [Deltaproteobacteria bacterium]